MTGAIDSSALAWRSREIIRLFERRGLMP